MKRFVGILGLAACFFMGCQDKQDPRPAHQTGDAGTGVQVGSIDVAYSSQVIPLRPVLEEYCIPCHSSERFGADRNGAPAGVDYDTFDVATANAESGNEWVQSGAMPPTTQLSDEEKQMFQTWISNGLLE